VNAGRVLRRAGYDTPELRHELAPIDPDLVNLWPASALMRRFWRPGFEGVTIGGLVFIDPAVLHGDPVRLARLTIHELVHVRQFAESGYLPFMARYLAQYGRGRLDGKDKRAAYLAVEAEAEARAVAGSARRITE
jgi:hypothetical protein